MGKKTQAKEQAKSVTQNLICIQSSAGVSNPAGSKSTKPIDIQRGECVI